MIFLFLLYTFPVDPAVKSTGCQYGVVSRLLGVGGCKKSAVPKDPSGRVLVGDHESRTCSGRGELHTHAPTVTYLAVYLNAYTPLALPFLLCSSPLAHLPTTHSHQHAHTHTSLHLMTEAQHTQVNTKTSLYIMETAVYLRGRATRKPRHGSAPRRPPSHRVMARGVTGYTYSSHADGISLRRFSFFLFNYVCGTSEGYCFAVSGRVKKGSFH